MIFYSAPVRPTAIFSVPRSALIIGGGDVAMDVASTLKILGCPSVTCVAREELAQFPASEKEFTSTQALGVSIIDGFYGLSPSAEIK
ncbi:oxidoreductase [Salmonella enterica subsp. enterica]|uniref:Oxidoreductase n=1 Tax=Salmonella enterica I TaxID=59201 RepID=A0A3S5DMQ1_SALET|nr:oxidoreductase [Salmonella enterica subsp. enterica]